MLFVEGVVTSLVRNEQGAKNVHRQSNNQPENVDGRVDFIFEYLPPGNRDVVSEHLLVTLTKQQHGGFQ